MKKISLYFLIVSLLTLAAALASVPGAVQARYVAQAAYQTPTPNLDGQILYTVQEGDTCTRIFLLTGVTIDAIITLNNLDADCAVFPGQQLLLGEVDPVTPTPEGPLPTQTPGPPTPTPFEGSSQICTALFEDLDGNQRRSATEMYLGGGVISVSNRIGTFSETKETVGGDPAVVGLVCFEDLPEGEYNLSMGIPDGFNPTTSMNYSLMVTAGDTIVVDFGAQPSTQMVDVDIPSGGGRSPLLLAIGLFFLAGGAGLAFFFLRTRMSS
jgi:LysM repeat protein